jgi:hypothetical protein
LSNLRLLAIVLLKRSAQVTSSISDNLSVQVFLHVTVYFPNA